MSGSFARARAFKYFPENRRTRTLDKRMQVRSPYESHQSRRAGQLTAGGMSGNGQGERFRSISSLSPHPRRIEAIGYPCVRPGGESVVHRNPAEIQLADHRLARLHGLTTPRAHLSVHKSPKNHHPPPLSDDRPTGSTSVQSTDYDQLRMLERMKR